MKKLFFLLLIPVLLFSCKNDEDTVPEKNSIASDLQKVIQEKNVEAIQICYVGMQCALTLGWGTNYSFEGDNIIRVRDKYYNLLRMEYYEIQTIQDSGATETRMVLYFPN